MHRRPAKMKVCLTIGLLSHIQKGYMEELLMRAGFELDEKGYIRVKEAKPGHPSVNKVPLPVGYIHNDKVFSINLGLEFPENYHGKLDEIYRAVKYIWI